MVRLAVNQRVGKKIPVIFWRRVVNKIVKTLKLKKEGEISLALVDAATIKKLNKIYRRKNQVTDALSFPEKDRHYRRFCLSRKNYWGEIVICYSRAQQQAKANKKTLEEELAWLLIHGTLHLLGYNHQRPGETKLMRQLEEKILNQLLV